MPISRRELQASLRRPLRPAHGGRWKQRSSGAATHLHFVQVIRGLTRHLRGRFFVCKKCQYSGHRAAIPALFHCFCSGSALASSAPLFTAVRQISLSGRERGERPFLGGSRCVLYHTYRKKKSGQVSLPSRTYSCPTTLTAYSARLVFSSRPSCAAAHHFRGEGMLRSAAANRSAFPSRR